MPKATPNPDQITPSPNGAPFLLAGFDPRQVGALPRRPRLPARGRRVTAPAQAGAAGLLASASWRAPCLRACALRQSDRENAPPERFQTVLWGRQARSAPAQAGAAGLSASGLLRAPCLRACALRQPDRENAPPERFQAVLWARNDGGRCGVVSGGFAWDRASTSFSGIAFEHAEVLPLPSLRAPGAIPAPDRPIADLRWRRFGRSADDVHSCIILDMMLLHRLCWHRAHPFLLAGFVRRHVGALPRRPRLPAPGRRVSAPAQAGATGLPLSASWRAPCLRACALRQSDRENAPPERFQAVLWARFSRVCRGVFAGDRSSGTSCGLANRRAPAGPVT